MDVGRIDDAAELGNVRVAVLSLLIRKSLKASAEVVEEDEGLLLSESRFAIQDDLHLLVELMAAFLVSCREQEQGGSLAGSSTPRCSRRF